MPLVPHEVAAVVAHRLRGLEPLMAGPHMPLVPPLSAAEQAMQLPVHAMLQRTPSAQTPLWH